MFNAIISNHYYFFNFLCKTVPNLTSNHISRHTVVCCAAQENRARANEVSILTGTTKHDLHESIAL